MTLNETRDCTPDRTSCKGHVNLCTQDDDNPPRDNSDQSENQKYIMNRVSVLLHTLSFMLFHFGCFGGDWDSKFWRS